MTTEDIIIHIFYEVDNSLPSLFTERHAKLHGSEVITIGMLFSLKHPPLRVLLIEHWSPSTFHWEIGGFSIRSLVSLRKGKVFSAV
jgi:hypothetical protein